MQGPQSPVRSITAAAGSSGITSKSAESSAFHAPAKTSILKTTALLSLLASLTLLTACEWPVGKIVPLREPPLVPSPPDAPIQAAAPQATHAASYADSADIQNFSPALAQAVTKALSLDVLRPATPQSKFEPEKPIGYGEFRQWANDYQDALNRAKAQASATATSLDKPASPAGPLAPPSSIEVTTQTWLPSEMLWGAQGVREQTVLTRETLCALAVFLSGQEAIAKKLKPAQIAQAQPGQGDMPEPDEAGNQDGALSQVSDYAKISPWALKYVALSYKNDWLENTFGFSAAKIVADEGFQPKLPVSRGEALLLLDQLFGQKAISASQNTDASNQPSATAPMDSLNGIGKPQAQMTGMGIQNPSVYGPSTSQQPTPVRQRAFQENGPQGTRQALQINGPE